MQELLGVVLPSIPLQLFCARFQLHAGLHALPFDRSCTCALAANLYKLCPHFIRGDFKQDDEPMR